MSSSSKRIVFLFSSYYLAFYLCRYSLLPVLPLLVEKRVLEASQVGLIISALYTGYAAMLVPAGFFSRRYGAKRTVIVGALGSILSNFLLAFAKDFGAMFVLMLTNGVFQGLVWPSLMYLTSVKCSGDEVDYAVGSMLTAAIFGPSAVFFSAGLIMMFFDPRTIFYAYSFVLCILTFIFYRSIEETSIEKKVFDKSVFININVWLLAVSYLCFYAIIKGTLGWLPVIVTSEAKLSPAIASIVSGIFPIVSSLGALLGTILSKKTVGKESILLASFTLSALVLLMLNKKNIVLWLVALFFTISLSEWFFFTIPPTFLSPEAVALASGIIDSMGYVGSSLGATVVGFMGSVYGDYCTALKALTIFCLAGVISSTILVKLRKTSKERNFRAKTS